jgi:hypothetical protein
MDRSCTSFYKEFAVKTKLRRKSTHEQTPENPIDRFDRFVRLRSGRVFHTPFSGRRGREIDHAGYFD